MTKEKPKIEAEKPVKPKIDYDEHAASRIMPPPNHNSVRDTLKPPPPPPRKPG